MQHCDFSEDKPAINHFGISLQYMQHFYASQDTWFVLYLSTLSSNTMNSLGDGLICDRFKFRISLEVLLG